MRKATVVLVGFAILFLLLGLTLPGQQRCHESGDGESLERCSETDTSDPGPRSPFVYYGLGGALGVAGVGFEVLSPFRSTDDTSGA